jgi:hypothetical protein
LEPKSRSLAARKKYIEILRKMTAEQRLAKAFELTEFSRALFRQGLRHRFPTMPDDEFEKLYRKRLDLCHNRNW